MNISLYFLIAASIMSSFQFINSFETVNADDLVDRYWIALNGKMQTPPVNTDAIGFVGLKFEENSRLLYNVNLVNIHNVTGVYLYHGNKTENGTIVLDLLKATRESNREYAKVLNSTKDGEISGTVNIGAITDIDLKGDLKGKSISKLHKMMDDGVLYVIVHTIDYPQGEIRGNSFVGMDDVFHDADKLNWK